MAKPLSRRVVERERSGSWIGKPSASIVARIRPLFACVAVASRKWPIPWASRARGRRPGGTQAVPGSKEMHPGSSGLVDYALRARDGRNRQGSLTCRRQEFGNGPPLTGLRASTSRRS